MIGIFLLCMLFFFIGARLGWKWGFEAHERIDDKILDKFKKHK